MSKEFKVALVTAAATLIAAAIPAGVLIWQAHSDADTQKRLAEEAQQREARSTARVLIGELDNATRVLCQAGVRGYLLKSPERLRTSLDREDLGALADQLDEAQFGLISRAAKRLEVWDEGYRIWAGHIINPARGHWGVPTIVDLTMRTRRELELLAAYPGGSAGNRVQCDFRKFKRREPGCDVSVESGGPPECAPPYPKEGRG